MAETDYVVLDPRFKPLIRFSASVQRLYHGCAWAEGPVYVPAYRQLIWSDVVNDRMLRYDEMSGNVGIFRQPAQYSNGNTLDFQGRLVTCQHGTRSVTRTEFDGAITVLAATHAGKPLNSPNDVVARSDGTIWFTDPTYGIDSDYEGHKATSEQQGAHVYRVEPDGDVVAVAADFVQPNGLAFSPDESLLYVSDTGLSHQSDGPRHIRRFAVGRNNSLSGGEIFAQCTEGVFDGFRVDREGRLWASARDGIHCYDPNGALIGKILVPERTANLAFGGPKRNILYICATTSLFCVRVAVNG
ncbi:gluconolactonase [Devosia geojensis]|uniref:Gluconolactonase n=1 Tax=Devosia geojensis TaxID=443610 RepID=A0A0F5FUY0_9HYPH|nr:SMP-30/gluconolactonase/LRE family protein [Devosia geojensis]KKB12623.1 gluconolactonase [Devosia geojensis]